MQISAKATFLGFAQALDPHTGLLEIAGVQIALAHAGGARAGDVLQVDAVRDLQGAWSGVISARLSPTDAMAMEQDPPAAAAMPSPPAAPAIATAGTRFARVNAVRGATAPDHAPAPTPTPAVAPPSPETARPAPLATTPGARRAGRFNVSSAGTAAHVGAAAAPARPRFVATSADERVRY